MKFRNPNPVRKTDEMEFIIDKAETPRNGKEYTISLHEVDTGMMMRMYVSLQDLEMIRDNLIRLIVRKRKIER